MTKCACCIGCKWYRRNEKNWCANPDRDPCENRQYWEADDDEGEKQDECAGLYRG